eukprot:scaffold77886_cov18-Tisochrysis_lutea.AAC.2
MSIRLYDDRTHHLEHSADPVVYTNEGAHRARDGVPENQVGHVHAEEKDVLLARQPHERECRFHERNQALVVKVLQGACACINEQLWLTKGFVPSTTAAYV